MFNKFRIGTKIGAGFAFGVVISAAIGLVIYQSATQTVEAARWETHTYEVLTDLETLMYNLKDAEAGQRNYLITGNEQYLESLQVLNQLLDQKLAGLRQLTRDNPRQQQHLNQIEPMLKRRLQRLEQTAKIRRESGFIAAVNSTSLKQGVDLDNDVRKLTQEMRNEELRLLDQRTEKSQAAARQMLYSISLGIPIYAVLLGLVGFFLTRNIARPLQTISMAAERVADDDLSVSLPLDDRQDEIGTLSQTFNQMIANLRTTQQQATEQDWLKTNLAKFAQMLQGQRDLEIASSLILSELAPLVSAQHGVFYLTRSDGNQKPFLKLLSTYAYRERKNLANHFQFGEGLVGQAALEKQQILLTEVPPDYIKISSGLGEATPLNIIVLPALFENQVIAVIELASFERFQEIHLTFLEQLARNIAIVLNSMIANQKTKELLEESQTLTEELQMQQEELTERNQRLSEQAKALRESEQMLKEQQEELQQTNEELEEKTELLALQNREMERKNQELERAGSSLEEKAKQLALTSKYKSEFLANMSHELRTPLNSLLILARLLSENGEGNLSQKQTEYAQTIYSAGNDLLALINDILDLTKIEAGMMTVEVSQTLFTDIRDQLQQTFRQVAQDKGLEFTIDLDASLPEAIETDLKRLQQVLKNLLANAFKFTDQGRVTLSISPVSYGWRSEQTALNQARCVIAFSISDTGIGIALDKQQVIFEAFQQADGTTSRRYGGTGLGLSISREIAHLLRGEIQLVSHPGEGSTFTLYMPQIYGRPKEQKIEGQARKPGGNGEVASFPIPHLPSPIQSSESSLSLPSASSLLAPQPQLPTENDLQDDRDTLQPGDLTLLIIEDDPNFARILLEMARQRGFKGLAATHGDGGLAMARRFKPTAIMLDINLPIMDGWQILDRLKHDPNTRHIPIHVMSVGEGKQRSLQQGAIAYLQKPISSDALLTALTDMKAFIDRPVKNLLIVEDDSLQRRSLIELIGNGDVISTAVGTGAEALEVLQSTRFDCMVLDLGLPDMSGFELIEQIKLQPNLGYLPIVVYTGKDLSHREETELRRISDTIIVKGVRSPERLLDETALFLHRVQASMPPPKRVMLDQIRQSDPVLAGKKALILDDDVRNIFALTSLLERYQVHVLYAENGRDGISVLQNNPDIDVVLMDVMMPEMDGYETTHAIRQIQQFSNLPIIALTAKAMQGDREKCIEAGASDYITKPVDTEQLLSLLRVWLYQ
ncbi:MAG: response regulator [Kovacikia sp.]